MKYLFCITLIFAFVCVYLSVWMYACFTKNYFENYLDGLKFYQYIYAAYQTCRFQLIFFYLFKDDGTCSFMWKWFCIRLLRVHIISIFFRSMKENDKIVYKFDYNFSVFTKQVKNIIRLIKNIRNTFLRYSKLVL